MTDQIVDIVQEVFFPGIATEAIDQEQFELHLDATVQALQASGIEVPTALDVKNLKPQIESIMGIDKQVTKSTTKVDKHKKVLVFTIGIALLALAMQARRVGLLGFAVIALFAVGVWKGDKLIAKLKL